MQQLRVRGSCRTGESKVIEAVLQITTSGISGTCLTCCVLHKGGHGGYNASTRVSS